MRQRAGKFFFSGCCIKVSKQAECKQKVLTLEVHLSNLSMSEDVWMLLEFGMHYREREREMSICNWIKWKAEEWVRESKVNSGLKKNRRGKRWREDRLQEEKKFAQNLLVDPRCILFRETFVALRLNCYLRLFLFLSAGLFYSKCLTQKKSRRFRKKICFFSRSFSHLSVVPRTPVLVLGTMDVHEWHQGSNWNQ